MDGVHFGKLKTLGGTNSDDMACYHPSQTYMTRPDKTIVALAGLSAITLVKGKMLQINLYNLLEDDRTYIQLFQQQQKVLKELLALPGNQ